jgi:hypothetical protein
MSRQSKRSDLGLRLKFKSKQDAIYNKRRNELLQSRGFQKEFAALAARSYNVVAYRFEAQRIAAKLEFAEVCARARKKTKFLPSRANFLRAGRSL